MCTKISKTAELYAYIFSFADEQTLARCARVCKNWTDTALDILWADMTTAFPLFHVLGPMKLDTNGDYTYVNEQPHSDDSWARLMTYGRRIKKLQIFHRTVGPLSQDAMKELRRPAMCLTPKLQDLSIIWLEGLEEDEDYHIPPERIYNICVLVLQENIQRLSLFVRPACFGFWASTLRRTTGLRDLEIKFMGVEWLQINDFNDFFSEMVPRLQSLENVSLPAGTLTPQLTQWFSGTCTSLKKILMVNGLPCRQPNELPANPFVQCSRPSFLEELQVETRFHYASSSLNDKDYPTLISLRIQSVGIDEDAKSLSRLLRNLSTALPSLRELTVGFLNRSFGHSVDDVSCEHLEALSSMKQLKAFSLQWPTPLKCTNKNLSELISKMPHIEELNLNSCPQIYQTDPGPVLTLDILPYIAQHCRGLQRLALFMDCTVVPSFNGPTSNCYTGGNDQWNHVFSNLKILDLGLSPIIRDYSILAMCLSRVISPHCQFTASYAWYTHANGAWPNVCHEVGRLAKMFSVVRGEERREAEMRVDRLVERIRELEKGMESERPHAS